MLTSERIAAKTVVARAVTGEHGAFQTIIGSDPRRVVSQWRGVDRLLSGFGPSGLTEWPADGDARCSLSLNI